MPSEITVYDRDFPNIRLLAEVRPTPASPADLDAAVQRLARSMWGANCHYGLIFTPKITYVLRDDFTRQGLEAIQVHDTFPTERVLSRMRLQSGEITSEKEL